MTKQHYDPDADAMYIRVRNERVHVTKQVDEATILDFNRDGQVIGVEILFVKERNPDILDELRKEDLILSKTSTRC